MFHKWLSEEKADKLDRNINTTSQRYNFKKDLFEESKKEKISSAFAFAADGNQKQPQTHIKEIKMIDNQQTINNLNQPKTSKSSRRTEDLNSVQHYINSLESGEFSDKDISIPNFLSTEPNRNISDIIYKHPNRTNLTHSNTNSNNISNLKDNKVLNFNQTKLNTQESYNLNNLNYNEIFKQSEEASQYKDSQIEQEKMRYE